jgi:hypothetical protein
VPNGYHGGEADWSRLEAPLRDIDPILEAFASAKQLTLTRNLRGEPERSLHYSSAVRRLIQLYVESASGPTFNVWVCASEDRGLERYWKRDFIARSVTPDELRKSLETWLEAAHDQLLRWNSEDLVFATTIQAVP